MRAYTPASWGKTTSSNMFYQLPLTKNVRCWLLFIPPLQKCVPIISNINSKALFSFNFVKGF